MLVKGRLSLRQLGLGWFTMRHGPGSAATSSRRTRPGSPVCGGRRRRPPNTGSARCCPATGSSPASPGCASTSPKAIRWCCCPVRRISSPTHRPVARRGRRHRQHLREPRRRVPGGLRCGILGRASGRSPMTCVLATACTGPMSWPMAIPCTISTCCAPSAVPLRSGRMQVWRGSPVARAGRSSAIAGPRWAESLLRRYADGRSRLRHNSSGPASTPVRGDPTEGQLAVAERMIRRRQNIGTFRRVAGLIVLALVAAPASALDSGELPEAVAKVFRARNRPKRLSAPTF